MKRLIFLAALFLFSVSKAENSIDIVSGDTVKTDSLTYPEVYDIFLFQNDLWPDGSPITVVTYPLHSPEHREFLFQYTGINYLGYSRRYNNRIDSGRGKPPIIVKDSFGMADAVSETEGGVGYIEKRIRETMAGYGIKVIEVR